jgi:hypothetical protein
LNDVLRFFQAPTNKTSDRSAVIIGAYKLSILNDLKYGDVLMPMPLNFVSECHYEEARKLGHWK